jgi:hypothetical protein
MTTFQIGGRFSRAVCSDAVLIRTIAILVGDHSPLHNDEAFAR